MKHVIPRIILLTIFGLVVFVGGSKNVNASYVCSPYWDTVAICEDDQTCIMGCDRWSPTGPSCYAVCEDLPSCDLFGIGWTGVFPACSPPITPTCTDLGFNAGTYPDCYNECANGSAGPYPSCPIAPPVDTCANGSPGPYPECPIGDTDLDCCSGGFCGLEPPCDIDIPPICIPDFSCVASTCTTDTCDIGCSLTAYGSLDCSVLPPPTCSNGSAGPYPACPLAPPTCAPTDCAAYTCTTDICVNTLSDCSSQPTSGSVDCSVCTPSPDFFCLANTCTTDASCSDGCGGFVAGNKDCSVSCDPGEGNACNTNACGVSGGTIQCDGSCSGGTPAVSDVCPQAGLQCSASVNQGNTCESSANTCNMKNSGTIQCDGNCSASAPPDSACPANPGLVLQANRTQVKQGETISLTWSATNALVPMNCALYGPGVSHNFVISPVNTTGTEWSLPINAKSVFTLSCDEPISLVTFTAAPVIVETQGVIEEI